MVSWHHLLRRSLVRSEKLSAIEPKVQECDAREEDKRYKAGLIEI